MAVSIDLGRFLAAAADVFRRSGEPAALTVGALLTGAGGCITGAEPFANRVPAVALHLKTALDATNAHPLLSHLPCDLSVLDWQEVEWDVGMPAAFVGRYAFVELIGPDGMLPYAGFRFGLYLQAPETYYPRHWHTAEELYFLVSGMADWRQGANPAVARFCGDFIRHAPGEPHAMRTFREPLLAMWSWIGDLDTASYRIDPGEWQ